MRGGRGCGDHDVEFTVSDSGPTRFGLGLKAALKSALSKPSSRISVSWRCSFSSGSNGISYSSARTFRGTVTIVGVIELRVHRFLETYVSLVKSQRIRNPLCIVNRTWFARDIGQGIVNKGADISRVNELFRLPNQRTDLPGVAFSIGITEPQLNKSEPHPPLIYAWIYSSLFRFEVD